MKNLVANNTHPKDEYWNRLTFNLSSYEVKDFSIDGRVVTKRVKDDYFLINDIWNVHDVGQITNFQEQFQSYKGTGKHLKWSSLKNDLIKLELKYVFYHKLFNNEWNFSSIFVSRNSNLNRLIEFLNEKYSYLHSFLELDIEKIEKEWILWLSNKGINTRRKVKDRYGNQLEMAATISTFPRNLYNSLFSITDTREELEKDIWDVRILNNKYGIRYNVSRSDYFIDFTVVKNAVFKNYLKKYIKHRLLVGKKFSWSSARNYMQAVPKFLNFIIEIEPDWNDLKGLERKHIERFLEYLRQYSEVNLTQKGANSKSFILRNVSWVYTFLKDIQRLEYDIAPEKSTSKLLFTEDYPTLDKKSDDDIEHIPDHILDQLFESINDLHPDVQPIVWVAFKTGLRISDVLGLRQGCLICLNGKYSIQTDIEKTYVKDHKIPIDDRLADMIAVLIHQSTERSNEDNNPDKYIFVRYSGSRKGKPFSQGWVRNKLNQLAIQKNITDEMGRIFHFKTHQFRHTYAVKLLNGGADILTVQELLAHASPEMTMRYARLLDDTKRKEFEKVVKQGVFSFDLNGKIHQVSEVEDIPEDILDMLWQDEKLNAIDNPYGTCRARVNGSCPLAAEPPCLTANDGKPCFDLAVGMTSFDIKKYELHIESATKMIEASKEYGRQDMVETNEKNLKRYRDIYETIRTGNVIFGRFERMKRQLEGKRRKGVKRD